MATCGGHPTPKVQKQRWCHPGPFLEYTCFTSSLVTHSTLRLRAYSILHNHHWDALPLTTKDSPCSRFLVSTSTQLVPTNWSNLFRASCSLLLLMGWRPREPIWALSPSIVSSTGNDIPIWARALPLTRGVLLYYSTQQNMKITVSHISHTVKATLTQSLSLMSTSSYENLRPEVNWSVDGLPGTIHLKLC